jgi:hypothetical protein
MSILMYLFTMIRMTLNTIALISALFSTAFSDSLSIHRAHDTMLPIGLVPLYEKPVSGSLPVSYCEPSDTCRVDSSIVDSTATQWMQVTSREKKGWVLKKALRSSQAGPDDIQTAGTILKNDPDAKRRYRILDQHPEWPRRIVKAVREGRICLDMSEEQTVASWGQPSQKGSTFILGAGSQDIWYYVMPDRKIQPVFLVKGRVVGWSEK